MIESSIYGQIQAPKQVNRLAQFAQMQELEAAHSKNRLSELVYGEKEREMSDNRLAADAYKSSVGADGTMDRNKLYSAFAQGGLGAKLPGVQKGFADADKASADMDKSKLEVSHKRIEMMGQTLGYVKDNPTVENATAAIRHMVQNGIMPPEKGQEALAAFQADPTPQGISKFATLGYQAALSAKDQLPKFETRNTGGTTDTIAINPVTGKTTVANSVRNTQSPDSVASTASAAAGRKQSAAQFKTNYDQKERELGADRGGSNPSLLGVPSPTVTPWANQTNAKDANKVRAAEATRGSKEIEKDSDAARKERDAAAAAKRFMELNKNTNTGGLTDRLGVTRYMQGMGADYSEMEAITAKLAPAMREPGSGSTSDFDGKQFERATVGVDKPGKTNTNIAKGMMARSQQTQEYADFRQTYLEQNGTLQGADRYWKDYANKNPIFDPAKDGTFELNTKRKTWNEHFKPAPQGAAKPTAPQGDGLSSSEQAELAALRKRLGK